MVLPLSLGTDVYIESFLKEWKNDYKRLERVHSYIQWYVLFTGCGVCFELMSSYSGDLACKGILIEVNRLSIRADVRHLSIIGIRDFFCWIADKMLKCANVQPTAISGW